MLTARLRYAILIPALLFALAGCGGGEDNGGGAAPITGVWTGTQQRAPDGAIEYDFVQNGTQVTGTSRITTPGGAIYTGALTGTVNGNSVDVTVTWVPAAYGTTRFVGTSGNSQLTGNYTHTPQVGAAEQGNLTLAKSSATTPTNVAGTYSGTGTITSGGSGTSPLTINFTQTGNSLGGTISVTISGFPVGGTISGTVIGNHITAGAGLVGGLNYTYDGTLSGATVSGTWSTAAPPASGTFTVTKS